MHTMDYVNAATTGTLLPHVLPIMDLEEDVITHRGKPYHLHCIYQYH